MIQSGGAIYVSPFSVFIYASRETDMYLILT